MFLVMNTYISAADRASGLVVLEKSIIYNEARREGFVLPLCPILKSYFPREYEDRRWKLGWKHIRRIMSLTYSLAPVCSPHTGRLLSLAIASPHRGVGHPLRFDFKAPPGALVTASLPPNYVSSVSISFPDALSSIIHVSSPFIPDKFLFFARWTTRRVAGDPEVSPRTYNRSCEVRNKRNTKRNNWREAWMSKTERTLRRQKRMRDRWNVKFRNRQ